jgi:5,10-methylenetetrahydromethanopterin reductase
MARLGLVTVGFAGVSFADMQELAREAEAAGVEAVFSPELMNDALANCSMMAQATSRINVGTWIANIYLRHPALCAQTAVAVDDISKGRLLLGLGVSHRPIVEGLFQEKMERPRDYLRQYVGTVQNVVTGKGYPGAPMQPRAAAHRVPIHIAALTLGTAELAGEIADGVMLYLCPKSRLPKVHAALEKGAAKAGRQVSAVDISTGLPTCISDDEQAARVTAKKNVAFYGRMPFYNKLFANSGFVQEAKGLAQGDAQSVSERMAEELMLIGSPARCREQLAAFRDAGIQLPIIVPVPVGKQTYVQAVRKAIETFA